MVTQDDAAQPLRTQSGRIGFNGELLECITSHYMLGNGYRAYSPLLMIFIQPDSWSPFGAGGLNAYAYCAGDPVNATDPSGHMPFPSTRPWNHWPRVPRFSPYRSPPRSSDNRRPGSPFTQNEQASRLLADAVAEPVAAGGRSPTGPATVSTSPVRSASVSVEPSPLVSASMPALGYSRVDSGRSQLAYGRSSWSAMAASHRLARIQERLAPMVRSRDANGLVNLASEHRSRAPVLQELFRKLPLSLKERAHAVANQGIVPKLRIRHVVALYDDAKIRGSARDKAFYEALFGVFGD